MYLTVALFMNSELSKSELLLKIATLTNQVKGLSDEEIYEIKVFQKAFMKKFISDDDELKKEIEKMISIPDMEAMKQIFPKESEQLSKEKEKIGMLKGVHLDVVPEDAKWIRYDMIRSLDTNLQQALAEGEGFLRQAFSALAGVGGGSLLDIQLYNLQRKYLDYQVNIGNRIIEKLQSGDTDAAQQLSQKKSRFQDIVDDLFRETGKKIIRTENELRFTQIGEVLLPYQLSSGEKQMLIILLTVLVEDNQPYVLFMDEPEVSLHLEWQKRLVDLCVELNPNVQIILTTQSPAIVMNGWVDSVTEVTDITV